MGDSFVDLPGGIEEMRRYHREQLAILKRERNEAVDSMACFRDGMDRAILERNKARRRVAQLETELAESVARGG